MQKDFESGKKDYAPALKGDPVLCGSRQQPVYIQLSDMDGRTVVGSAFRSYTVDADGEIPQVAQLYLLQRLCLKQWSF